MDREKTKFGLLNAAGGAVALEPLLDSTGAAG